MTLGVLKRWYEWKTGTARHLCLSLSSVRTYALISTCCIAPKANRDEGVLISIDRRIVEVEKLGERKLDIEGSIVVFVIY